MFKVESDNDGETQKVTT